jgi:hypothetical protein
MPDAWRRSGWWDPANRGSMKPGPDDTATMDRRIDLQLCREMGGAITSNSHRETES